MAAPTRRAEQHTTANATTAVNTGSGVAQVGDLILVWVANAEATPNLSIAVSNITLSIAAGTNVLTGGAGGNSKLRVADATNSMYGHVWAMTVVSIGAVNNATFTVDTSAGSYSTGTRRFGCIVINPNGNTFSSTTPVRHIPATLQGIGSADVAVSWTESRSALAGAAIGLALNTSNKTYGFDWDNDAGSDYSNNTAGDTGDGGSTVFLGGTGSGSNQAYCVGDAYWDNGGIPGGSDTQVTFHGSTTSGSKAVVAGYWAVASVVTPMSPGKGAEASGAKARLKQGKARLSGKGAGASKGYATIRHAILLKVKGATVSDGKLTGMGRARGIANGKGPEASKGKAKLDPKQRIGPAKGAEASKGKALINLPAVTHLPAAKGATASKGKSVGLDQKQHLHAGKGATASFGRASLGHHVDTMANSAVLSNFTTYTASLSNFTTFTVSLTNNPKLTARIRNA